MSLSSRRLHPVNPEGIRGYQDALQSSTLVQPGFSSVFLLSYFLRLL